MSKLNLPWHNLMPSPLILSLLAGKRLTPTSPQLHFMDLVEAKNTSRAIDTCHESRKGEENETRLSAVTPQILIAFNKLSLAKQFTSIGALV